MSPSFKAACIQNCATPDVAHNLEVSLRLLREAAGGGADAARGRIPALRHDRPFTSADLARRQGAEMKIKT